MAVGAKDWSNPNSLRYGLLFGALIISVLLRRHFVPDTGRFADRMLIDLDLRCQNVGARRMESSHIGC